MGIKFDLQEFGTNLISLLVSHKIPFRAIAINLKFNTTEMKGIQFTWQYSNLNDNDFHEELYFVDVKTLGEQLITFLNNHDLHPFDVGLNIFVPNMQFDIITKDSIDLVDKNLLRKISVSEDGSRLYIQFARHFD
jgi:hypothetical protein